MKRAELLETYLQSAQSLQRLWKLHFQQFLASSGVSHAQIGLLFLISQKQPVSSTDLAEELQISRSAVAQLLDVVDRHGFIVREPSTQDRRTTYISLSAAGQKKLSDLNERRMKIHAALAADTTDEELQFLINRQAIMIEHLEAALSRLDKKARKE